MDKPKVLIIGASGLVGEEILKTTEGMGQEIVTLSRRKLISKNQDTEEIIINFDDLQLSDIPKVNHVYIALGTELDTSELIYIKKSRRKGFRKVENEYVTKIAKMAHGNGAESISVVSAVGANKSSRNLYLKTKGEMEEKIISIGYNKTVFAQPGHLLGKRLLKKIRPEVPIMEFGERILKPLMIGPLEDLKFIKASLVAKSMVKHMNIPTDKIVRLKYKELIDI